MAEYTLVLSDGLTHEDFVEAVQECGCVHSVTYPGDEDKEAYQDGWIASDGNSFASFIDAPVLGVRYVWIQGSEESSWNLVRCLTPWLPSYEKDELIEDAYEAKKHDEAVQAIFRVAAGFPYYRPAVLKLFDYYLNIDKPLIRKATIQAIAYRLWSESIFLLEQVVQHDPDEDVRKFAQKILDYAQTKKHNNSVEESSSITEKQANNSESANSHEPLTAQKLQERFKSSHRQSQKSAWCEQINSQYGHFRQGSNTGFTIPGRIEAIEDIYDHFFPNAVIGYEPEELKQWLTQGYQSHPNYGMGSLQPKTISNLRKPDAEDRDAIIAIATEDASVVEQFFCELLAVKREIF